MSATDHLRLAHPRLVRLHESGINLREYQCRVRKAIDESAPTTRATMTLGRAVASVSAGFDPVFRDLVTATATPKWASFAEHHAPITHPETTNVVANLAMFAGGAGSTVRTLSCGTTPLDNELFPRGVHIGSERAPLMSNRQRRRAVICADPWDVQDARTRLLTHTSSPDTKRAIRDAVIDWFDALAPQISGLPSLWQQISIMNFDLGQRMFADGGFAYLSIPMECVAAQVLVDWFSSGTVNWITTMLTDGAALGDVTNALDGTTGFFDTVARRGSVMVWDSHDGTLRACGLTATESIIRSPNEWVAALSSGSTIPTAGLALLVLAFGLELPNFGGLLQYDYLAEARRRLLASATILTPQEHSQLGAAIDSFYVNFENRPPTSGGLARLSQPVSWADLNAEANKGMRDHTGDCLRWLASSFGGRR